MKFFRWLFVPLSFVLLFGCGERRQPAAPVDVGPAIAAPVLLRDALMTVTVSDAQGLLDGAGTVVSQISPMMGGPMLKALLGGKLGDPQLSGLAPGKGFVAVWLNKESFFAAAEIVPSQVGTYVKTFQNMGLQSRTVGGLLLVAQTGAQLDAAEPLVPTIQTKLLSAPRSSAIQIAFQPAELIAKNEELFTGGLQKMLAQIQNSSATNDTVKIEKILEGEMRVLLSIGRQIDSLEIAIQPVDGSVKISEVLDPVAGSRLAAFCNAPALRGMNPEIRAGYLSRGAINMESCVRNQEALTVFFAEESKLLFEELGLDAGAAQHFIDYMTQWMTVCSGSMCKTVLSGSDQSLSVGAMADITKESDLLSLLRTLPAELEAFGLFDFYKKMGMPLSLEFNENVRKVSGVSVHQLKIDFSVENLPPEQVEMFNAMMGDMVYDIAFYKNTMIYTLGTGEIENVIARLKDGEFVSKPLVARNAFPSGGIYYMDFDIGKYVSFVGKLVSNLSTAPASIEKMVETLAGAEPVSMAAFCNKGRLQSDVLIPGQLLVRFAQVGQLIAVDAMQKKAAGKAAVPEIGSPAGNPAPDVTFRLLDGSSVALSSHLGKQVVVLDFWASWCGPCRKGLPVVQKTAGKFSGDEVVFYAINLREDEAAIKSFVEDTGLTLSVVLDDGTLGKAFGMGGIPHTVVIDKQGVIQSVHAGFSPGLETELPAEISAALAN